MVESKDLEIQKNRASALITFLENMQKKGEIKTTTLDNDKVAE